MRLIKRGRAVGLEEAPAAATSESSTPLRLPLVGKWSGGGGALPRAGMEAQPHGRRNNFRSHLSLQSMQLRGAPTGAPPQVARFHRLAV